MKYIFCGNMFSDAENDIKKMRVPPPVSDHKYMSNIVRGLIENGQDVTVLNTPRIRYFPNYPSIFVHRSDFMLDGEKLGQNSGFVNLPLINYVTRTWSLKKGLRKMLRNIQDKEIALVCFNVFFPVVSCMAYAKTKYKNVHLCMITGDLPGNYGTRSTLRGIKEIIAGYIGNRTNNLVKRFDSYGFLTRYMAAAMGVADKPFVVIEGMYSENSEPIKVSPDTKDKMVFYAGAIRQEYGILHLLKAFSLIKGNEYRLVLAGGPNGDAVNEVKKYADHDNRISYLGYLTPSEVEKYQQSATVLVNPRTSEHAFVKYSFPSKNMECLASGKPYIAHDLICNPPEYREYIQCPADESDEALADKIAEVCNFSKEKRDEIGKAARQFILTEKNPKVQCKKIIDMMNCLIQQ